MIKRLSISLLLMGLAVFSLGAAAFAWFSTSETGNVSIETGSTDIAVDVDQDCNGTEVTIDGTTATLEWHGIVPGQATRDCFEVRNTGDGDLDIYIQHSNVTGNTELRGEVEFTYDTDNDDSNGVLCGSSGVAEANRFTSANGERGCLLGTIPNGGAPLYFEARVLFPDDGDQDTMQNKGFDMVSTITGYTG